MKIAVVVSEFNQEVTSRMLSVAQEKAEKIEIKNNLYLSSSRSI